MAEFMIVSASGVVTQVMRTNVPLEDLGALYPNMRIVEQQAGVASGWYEDESGQFLNPGDPPTEHHEFDYATKQWVFLSESAWGAVRWQRNRLLAGTDWVVLRAQDQGEPVPQEWLDYRQALRDVTEQADPLNIEWPTPPA